jgi:hypothetical protein
MDVLPVEVKLQGDLRVQIDPANGRTASLTLYGRELLTPPREGEHASELWVNGRALPLRAHVDPHDPTRALRHLKGECFVDHFAGWGLVLSRGIGDRPGLRHPCVGVRSLVRREPCDQTLPCPGPGGPVIEAPLHVDTFGILRWNWQFWGESTRMVFASSHSSGPADEFGHVGYEHDTPAACKRFLQNVWRRIYPGCMVIHGGLFYDADTGQWLAITCRRPQVGYILDIDHAGDGVSYDFTLHAAFAPGESLTLPEIKLYHGPDRASMDDWLADYVTHYYQPPPAWVGRSLFMPGLAWDNAPTWTQQADRWLERIEQRQGNAVGYSLVTNRPVRSGTTPTGYEPDPNHGTSDEFRDMCHRLADRGVPLLIWMSHSGLCYRGGDDIDDDWFIRGIDGNLCAAWGSIDHQELAHINPGHPGYIDYTCRWIRFYLRECRCKGIFLDCLSWAFPPDFRPRSWMRYPGDTNRMAIRFIEAVYACIKDCDPEAILLGEGTTLDAAVNVFSVNTNPRRAIDGLGPRDFLLSLNARASKRLAIDQGPRLAPACGFCSADPRPEFTEHNRFLQDYLAQHGAGSFTALPGDLAVHGELLFVPAGDPRDVTLPPPWQETTRLVSVLTNAAATLTATGATFAAVPPGVYRMER